MQVRKAMEFRKQLNHTRTMRVRPIALCGTTALLLLGALLATIWGQQATSQIDFSSMISTANVKFTPAIFINDGVYLPDESTKAAVSGGKIGNASAQGIRISSNANDFNGIYVKGSKSNYTLSNAAINLSGNGSNDFLGIGSGAMVNGGGTLVLKNVRITTDGVVRSATTSTDHSTLRVYDSTLTANGGALPKGYVAKIGAGMMEPPAPLGLSGTARTCLTLNNSSSYFYNSTIVADGWGALSTDIALDHVYLEANNCDVQVRNKGYGTYADWNCKVVINNSKISTAGYAGIIASIGEIRFNKVNASSSGRGFLIHSVMRSNPAEIGLLEIIGGIITTQDTLILVKSANADITLDRAKLVSKSGSLIHSVVNDDSMATKINGQKVPGIRATLKNTTIEGDILHEDTERTMSVDLIATALKGAVKDASLSLDAGSRWTATSNSNMTLINAVDVSRIDALPGVIITAIAGQGCTLKGSYKLSSGGTLNVKAN
jgi:hypothetical protein